MIIAYSKNLVPIRLTEERWSHIIRRHPEIKNQKTKVIETISNPDMICLGDFGELLAVRFYQETPLTQKYFIIAYKEISTKRWVHCNSLFLQINHQRGGKLYGSLKNP